MIPDEAVEAALAVYDPSIASVPGDWEQYFQRRMRAALEAAAPHMMAQAWDEGAASALDALNKQIRREPYKMANPYEKAPK